MLNLCTKLFGRDEQQRSLFDAYNNSRLSQSDTNKVNVIVIKGCSGCGKTALVNSLREELHPTNGTIMEWKSERQALLQINPGFTKALQTWMQSILSLDSDKLNDWKNRLNNSLDDSEKIILVKRMPLLKPFFSIENLDQDQNEGYRSDWKLFLKFLNASSSTEFPLVIWVDDFHWIEKTALQWVMNAIQSSVSAKGMSFVLTYNDEWEQDDYPFWKQGLDELRSKQNICITDIPLEPLKIQNVKTWMENLFRTSAPAIEAIANYVYQQTKGHPLYTIEVVKFLNENSLIHYHEESNCFEINEKNGSIPQNLETCSSATDLLSKRLQSISQETMEVLKVIACMGYHVKIKLLSHAIPYNLPNHLEEASDAHILAFYQNDHTSKSINDNGIPAFIRQRLYHFTNNSMHQAVINAIGGPQEIQQMHLSIARKLIRNLSDDDLKSELLIVLGHAIQGKRFIRDQDKQSLALLALDAAQKAVNLTSFESAQKSITFAIEMLNENCWKSEYDLSLTIYNAAAEIAYAGGDYEQVELMITEVMKCALTFEDKIQAYTTKLYVLGSRNSPSEAIALGLKVLEQLGERFPLHPKRRHVLSAFIKTRLSLRKKSDEMLLRMPTISDERAAAALTIMNILVPSSFFQRPNLVPLLAFRMIQVSLKFGMSAVSCMAFALYGILLVGSVNKTGEGIRMGDLSLRLLDRFQAKAWIPRVYAIVYGFIHGYHRPINEAFNKFLRGHRIALETGDIEVSTFCNGQKTADLSTNKRQFAMINIFNYLYFLFDSGAPLEKVKEEYRMYAEELSHKHSNSTIFMQTSFVDTIDQLMVNQAFSKQSTSRLPKGAVLNFDASMKILLSILNGDYQQAVDVGHLFFKQYPIEIFDYISFYMLVGVANVAVFKETGKIRAHLIIAARYYKKHLNRVCRSAIHFCLSKLKLLEAELSSVLHYDHSRTTQCFTIAISLADSKNHIFEAAFARERFARYLLSRGDHTSSMTYFQSSCRLYHKWNAYSKVALLEEEINDLASSLSSDVFQNNSDTVNQGSSSTS
jgi:predicted ATPase